MGHSNNDDFVNPYTIEDVEGESNLGEQNASSPCSLAIDYGDSAIRRDAFRDFPR